jgi:hypothetical protein
MWWKEMKIKIKTWRSNSNEPNVEGLNW